MIADGLYFALRVDTNRPPTDLIRSYQRINEEAMLEASGREFLSKPQRREAREQAVSRADAEAREGSFRRTRQVPVFWDLKRNEVYLGGTSPTLADQFMLLFRETFDRATTPATSGEIAARWSSRTSAVHPYDTCRPAYFIKPPDNLESADGDPLPSDEQSKDFLGTEWLAWLWYASHVESPEIATGLDQPIPVLFEKSLRMECAFKINGSVAIQAEGPTHGPEAPVALAAGKRPIAAGLQLAVHGDVFSLQIRGDVMHYTGVRVPAPENPSNPRIVFEDRIDHLRDLIEAIDELYAAFLKKRLSGKWPQTLNAIRHWVTTGLRPAPRLDAEPEPMAAS